MEIHAFDKVEERVKKVIEFRENYGLYFEKESCYDKYAPKLFLYNEKGKQETSREAVENLTGVSYEYALYLTALLDATMNNYVTYNAEKQSREDYLKENLPLAIFSAEWVANQCVKKQRENQSSVFSFEDVAERLLDKLVELEALGVEGLHVTRSMQKKMEEIMKSPAFLVILNKELQKQDMSVLSGDYIDEKGHEANKERTSKMLRVNIIERTK